MLETIAVLLFVIWMIGFLSSYMLGGYIHVLLIAAALMLLTCLVKGRSYDSRQSELECRSRRHARARIRDVPWPQGRERP